MRYACYLHALHYGKCPVTSIVWSLHSKCIQLRPTIIHIKNVMICKICNHNLNCIGILFQNWHVFRVCLRKDEGINHQLHLFQEKVSGGDFLQLWRWALLTVYGRQLKYRKLLQPYKRSVGVDKWNLGNQFISPQPPSTQPNPKPPPSPLQTSFPEILSQRGVGEWGVKITIHTYM